MDACRCFASNTSGSGLQMLYQPSMRRSCCRSGTSRWRAWRGGRRVLGNLRAPPKGVGRPHALGVGRPHLLCSGCPGILLVLRAPPMHTGNLGLEGWQLGRDITGLASLLFLKLKHVLSAYVHRSKIVRSILAPPSPPLPPPPAFPPFMCKQV